MSAKHSRKPKERLQRIWEGMKRRCQSPKHKHYRDYGGRGIRVCPLWDWSYVAFKRWAFKHGYQENLILDRRNPNAGYSPQNCRWVTWKESAHNRRDNRRATAWGETKLLAEWVEDDRCIIGNYRLLHARIRRHGWDAERALTTPVGKLPPGGGRTRILEAFGERKSVARWVEDPRCQVSREALRQRIDCLGWEVERALTEPPRRC